MKRYPIVLTIAGSDCIGGSGVPADIKTISALGAYAASVTTALIVGNTTGLKDLFPIPQETIKLQIETVMEDIIPDVVKLGLLNDIETARTVGSCMRKYHPKYVVYDLVILPENNIRRMIKENMDIIKRELLPFTNLVVMNCQEAELLSEHHIKSVDDMRRVAGLLSQKYIVSILIKSGELYKNELYDILRTPADEEWVFRSDMIYSSNSYGASCTFSSAIATYLALGEDMHRAVPKAREFVRNALLYGRDVSIGHGNGPVCQTFDPEKMKFADY